MADSGKHDGDVQTALSNAFSREYLDRLREGSETSASGESEAAGPWELRHEEGVYPLFRSWEGFEHGDSPEGVFQVREAGLIFFAVRPAAGRVRIPTKPATHSDVKAATHSEAKAATLPELAASRAHGGSKWPS